METPQFSLPLLPGLRPDSLLIQKQTIDSVCNVDNLPAQIVEADLDMYDKALYREPACLGEPPLPAQCDYMGLAEDCSCCFMTCEGANKYLAEYLEDIDETFVSDFVYVYYHGPHSSTQTRSAGHNLIREE